MPRITYILLFFLIISLFNLLLIDEKLKPELQVFLTSPVIIDNEKNGYFDLFGFLAPLDKIPNQFGFEQIKAWKTAIEHNNPDPFPITKLPDVKRIENLCVIKEKIDLNWCREYSSQIIELTKIYQPWLTRYTSLVQKKMYIQPVFDSLPSLPVSSIISVQRLYHAKLLVNYFKGNYKTTLKSLFIELTFNKMQLTQSSTLLNKKRAMFLFYNTLNLYSQLLDISKPSVELVDTINNISLSQKEWGVSSLINGQLQLTTKMLLQLKKTCLIENNECPYFSFIERHVFFKKNALANFNYQLINKGMNYDKLSIDALAKKYNIKRKKSSWNYFDIIFNFSKVYIQIWDVTLNEALEYRFLNGLITLLKLKAQLRSKDIELTQVNTFLELHQKSYSGLFKDHPIQWDKQKQIIFYTAPKVLELRYNKLFQQLDLKFND